MQFKEAGIWSHILYIHCRQAKVLSDKGDLYITYYEHLTAARDSLLS